MPFDLFLECDGNTITGIVIDENVKNSLNTKSHSVENADGMSFVEIYARAGLSDREIWELSKIELELSRQNMAFEKMSVVQETICETLVIFYEEMSKNILAAKTLI